MKQTSKVFKMDEAFALSAKGLFDSEVVYR